MCGGVRVVLMDHVVVHVSMINPFIQLMQVHAYKYNGAPGANQNMRLTTLAQKAIQVCGGVRVVLIDHVVV